MQLLGAPPPGNMFPPRLPRTSAGCLEIGLAGIGRPNSANLAELCNIRPVLAQVGTIFAKRGLVNIGPTLGQHRANTASGQTKSPKRCRNRASVAASQADRLGYAQRHQSQNSSFQILFEACRDIVVVRAQVLYALVSANHSATSTGYLGSSQESCTPSQIPSRRIAQTRDRGRRGMATCPRQGGPAPQTARSRTPDLGPERAQPRTPKSSRANPRPTRRRPEWSRRAWCWAPPLGPASNPLTTPCSRMAETPKGDHPLQRLPADAPPLRAEASLKRQKWAGALRDAAAAILLDPTWAKSWQRYAAACDGLGSDEVAARARAVRGNRSGSEARDGLVARPVPRERPRVPSGGRLWEALCCEGRSGRRADVLAGESGQPFHILVIGEPPISLFLWFAGHFLISPTHARSVYFRNDWCKFRAEGDTKSDTMADNRDGSLPWYSGRPLRCGRALLALPTGSRRQAQ